MTPRGEKLGWIDLLSVDQDFVVHVRPGAAARVAKDTDGLAMGDALALLDQQPAEVA
jgi:hypothetical protein